MNENNVNYIGPADARNFDEDDYYIFTIGLNNKKIIIYIIPEYKNTLEFREKYNIGLYWSKKFLTIEDAMKELNNFVYDEYFIFTE